ncbi:unnamed protein product [Linum tenue]|uniref:50S ribosomal protein L19, chloroplastic n=1 Tax=Linum tenue TaxID=586396 RepID=A0AAV0HDS5_9ROSI|nr:unnamed protein product [Linum tenue]
MGSKILPQALLTIPINHAAAQSPPARRLGFTCSTNRAAIPSSACCSISRISGSGVSPNSLALTELVAAFTRHRVVARAEAEGSSGELAGDGGAELAVAGEDVEGEEGASVEGEEVEKTPWQPRVRLGDVMGILNKRAVEASELERPIPDIRTGDIVEIKLEVPENRRRLSIYKGIVMSRQNAGIHTTIRIRRIIAGIGVEIVFPLYSPNIKEIKVVSHRKVRRARLYYLRDKLPRLSTFK